MCLGPRKVWFIKAEKREKKGDTSLTNRLNLGAFSNTVGRRPTGLNLGQACLFIERFPSEFRMGAVSKVVMSCSKGKACVCPDRKLPCCSDPRAPPSR